MPKKRRGSRPKLPRQSAFFKKRETKNMNADNHTNAHANNNLPKLSHNSRRNASTALGNNVH